MRLRISLLALAACCIAPAASAQPLNVVNVSAPQINCVFSTSCSVTVSDVTSSVLGGGFLQSRTFRGQPGSPAAGKWVYEYRLDLTHVAGAAAPPQVSGLAIQFAATPIAMDFNGDGNATDQVFVTTGGALGSVVPASVYQYGDTLHITFAPPVNGGQSSYFIGLVSVNAPRAVGARVETNVAGSVFVDARAPEFGWGTAATAAPSRVSPGSVPPARVRPTPPPPAAKP